MTWRFLKFIYIVLSIECIIFALFYYAGFHGIVYIQSLHHECHRLDQEIQQAMTYKQQLEEEYQAWQQNDFVKEQYARERLHMKKKEEVVYFMKKDKK